MEADHIVAVGLFILLFGFSALFVTNHVSATEESIRTDALEQKADIIFESILRSDTNISLESDVYKFYVEVRNENNSLITNELSMIDLSMLSGFDENSLLIYDDSGNEHDFNVNGNYVTFFAGNIPAKSSKWFTVYVDDNSNFYDRKHAVNGTDVVRERITGPEKIAVIQYRRLSNIKNMNYSSFSYDRDFHISVYTDNKSLLDYGSLLEAGGSVTVRKLPVFVQLANASFAEGILEIKVW